MSEALKPVLNRVGKRYPHALARKYPRVLNKITGLWGKPSLHAYFSDLLVDDRGERRGFPADVVADIVYMNALSLQQFSRAEYNPWGHNKAAVLVELKRLGMSFNVQAFLKASKEGDVRLVSLFLSAGMPVDSCDSHAWTALMHASMHGHAEMVTLLLKHRANINHRNNRGCTALYWAAFSGHVKVTQLLLSNGALPDLASHHGWTPLLQAAARGHLLICWMLLSWGAEVNAVSDDGWTPLHKAAATGHFAEVVLLLNKGAKVDAKYADGSTALDWALKNGHDRIADRLIDVLRK